MGALALCMLPYFVFSVVSWHLLPSCPAARCPAAPCPVAILVNIDFCVIVIYFSFLQRLNNMLSQRSPSFSFSIAFALDL